MSQWPTDFVVAQPGLASGVGSVLDLSGILDAYNISRTPGEADLKALLNDWYNVGSDLAFAMQNANQKEA